MKRPREQDTVHAILALLHAHRIPAWHMRTGATKIGGRFIRFGSVGMSDIIGLIPRCGKCRRFPIADRCEQDQTLYRDGRFLAIEVKSGIGRVTAFQQAFLDQVNAAGGKAFVARTLDDVTKELGLEPTPPSDRFRAKLYERKPDGYMTPKRLAKFRGPRP